MQDGTRFAIASGDIDEDWIVRSMGNGSLQSGHSTIDLEGRTPNANGQIVYPPGQFPKFKPDNGNRKLAVTIGTRRVLAVRVFGKRGSFSQTEEFLSDSIFGANVNLKTQYYDCSHGDLIFDPAVDDDSNDQSVVTNIRNGVTTVDVGRARGDGQMVNEAIRQLNAKFGVSSPTQLAHHVMFCLPSGSFNGIAYAYFDSWDSVYNDLWCTYVSAHMRLVTICEYFIY